MRVREETEGGMEDTEKHNRGKSIQYSQYRGLQEEKTESRNTTSITNVELYIDNNQVSGLDNLVRMHVPSK